MKMDALTTAFQFEIRYNHILNFSQIARKILSPFVRLAKSIRVENQNTLEERIILNFEDEDYLIIVGWDRLLIKGQGDLSIYTSKNSPIETPFFSILERVQELEEFGSILNILFAANYIKKIKIKEENLVENIFAKTVQDGVSKIMKKNTDFAINIVNKESGDEKIILYGPYSGTEELKRRPITPVNLDNLKDTGFFGAMLEYKHLKITNKIGFKEFIEMTKISNKIKEEVWKTL